ncbi:MAG TPA: nucleotide exchange factor GrpE [Gammaproteobacteria bacterium]|nr:nucleotide exchange factor GrpE [Gammaproteobacteria bacterium]HAU24240.1 nucleotide exchange factor GrpE [Gammaproteobacteria bacterium]HCI87770.1 nucleotide exchange factor GrpE [Gammaproteobacteria bacterium]|tara:strand:- start:2260 stop:2886 length:627 start_codon:yes stop_codon:yes gene_type:complete
MSKEPHQEAAEQTGTAAEELQDLEQAQVGAETGDDTNTDQDISLEQALEKLAQAELAAQKAHDDLLRVQAEMQNLRRRTEQDIEKAHKYGQEKFSAELLSVMDNLERALDAASAHENEAVKAIYDGVDLTLKSFSDCFSKFNIEAVDPLGEPFDPALHQAMSMQENPDVEPNTIIAVMQKGYTLHGRVIRPAMVMVAKGSSPKIDEAV